MGILNRPTKATETPTEASDTAAPLTEASYACLHAGIFIPNLGQFGPTLTVGSGSTISKIASMTVDNTFLTIKVQDVKSSATILVPLTNVTHLKLK